MLFYKLGPLLMLAVASNAQFTQRYRVITGTNSNQIQIRAQSADDQGSEKNDGNQQGLKLWTSGRLFRPTSVILDVQPQSDKPFLGGLQPRDANKDGNENFFLNSVCTLTSVDTNPNVDDGGFDFQAHQCIYDLCAGGRGFNCVSFYAGGAFPFSPFDTNSINGLEPPVPPPFKGTIFAATGAYRGATGTCEVITLCGRNSDQQGAIVQDIVCKTSVQLAASVE